MKAMLHQVVLAQHEERLCGKRGMCQGQKQMLPQLRRQQYIMMAVVGVLRLSQLAEFSAGCAYR